MTSKFVPGVQDCPHCMARVFILADGDFHPVVADIASAAIKIAVHRSFADEHEFLNNR